MATQHRQLPLWVALTVVMAACLSPIFSPNVSAQTVDTQMVVTGPDDVRKFLEAVLDANKSDGRRPPEPVTVLQRAQLKQRELLRALRSEGFYGGTVETRFAGELIDDPALFDRLEELIKSETIEVRFAVVTGKRYRFKAPTVLDAGTGRPVDPALVDSNALAARAGRGASADRVVVSDQRIVRQMQERGHPYARIDDREAVVDHADDSMTVTWRVIPGPVAKLGAVAFKGLERTRPGFLAERVPFKTGAPYSPATVDALSDELLGLGIFSSVKVEQAPQLDQAGQLPLTVEVVERAPRTIGIGASYATTEGFGARAYWQHRNLFGGAETLRLSAEVGGLLENKLTQPSFGLFAHYREPDFLQRHLDLTADLFAERKILDAYTKQSIGAGLGLERLFDKGLKGSVGIGLEQSIQTKDGDRERFTLLGLPVTLALDRSNDLLNPTKGYRLAAIVTPYADMINPATRFLVGRLTGTAYLDLSSNKSTVLAGRASAASLIDFGTSIVPFDKLLYSGGGGSVRGYAFQSLGPRDGKDPLGGRSSIELSAELRQRIGGRFGMAVFVDAGNVYADSTPDPGKGLQFGAGIGGRYYTDFGPLRFDVAVPINRRKGDDRFGLYVSLGQAF